jgi:hypothetical protein
MILSTVLSNRHPLLVCLDVLCSVVLFVVVWLWRRRRQTRRLLERCNLPTVTWTPRFLNYIPKKEELANNNDKMKSSAITGILPRMERLGGPFGMYGTVYGISIPVVHIAHPVPAKSILMETTNGSKAGQRRRMSITASSGASKAPAYNHFKNFSGNGVFTADGEEWKEKRASVIHCLLKGVSNCNSPAAQRLEREANYAATSFITELEERRREEETGADEPVEIDNVVPILQRATIGLIYRYITHDDKPRTAQNEGNTTAAETTADVHSPASPGLKSASSSSSSLCSLVTPTADVPDDTCKSAPPEICPPSLLQAYLHSVTDIRMIILAQSRSFWFLLPRWVYRTFSNMYKEEETTMGPIRDFASRTCERAQPGSPLALLRQRPSHSAADDSADDLSQNMIDEAITLLFAGQDTSAATLSWTLHLLSLYPEIQERLANEIRTVLLESDEHEGATPTRFSKKLVSKMPFLDAVIKESMRLYPVAPFVVRRLQHEVTAKDDKVSATIPAGAFACIWIYGLHRNPELWNRPNDFVPDRWIDPSLRALDAGQEMVGAYMPFAAGPRSCVGQPLANVILRIVLARIVDRYSFSDKSRASGGDPTKLRKDMQAGFTVLPVGGLKLSVSTRPTT